jgi:mono/diheme cytochrome c family protein
MKRLVIACLLCCAAPHLSAQDAAVLDRGKAVYEYWCDTCHGEGDAYPGTVALSVKYGGAVPGELEQRTDLTPEFVKTFVRNGISVMPFFRKTEISDSDLDALAQYLTAGER